MKIKILTLFPELFGNFLKASILGKALEKDLLEIEIFNLRDWAKDKHQKVDDKPFGGNAGMVLKADIIDAALKDLKTSKSQVILLTPQGKTFSQQKAVELKDQSEIILICGRYEGFDERVTELVDQEISIGQYVLSGGEIPAMVVIEAVSRLIPGVANKQESIETESFANGSDQLDYPEYTLPREFKPKSKNIKSLKVPLVLLSGDHEKIKQWREQKAIKKTEKRNLT